MKLSTTKNRKFFITTLVFSILLTSFSILGIDKQLFSTINDYQVEAANIGTFKTTSAANIRKDAGTNYKVVTTLAKGKTFTAIGSKKVGGKTWYKLTVNGKTGWISSAIVKKVTSKTTTKKTETKSSSKIKKTTVDLTLRNGAGTNYKAITTIPKGIHVTIKSTKNGWANVTVGKYKGWVSTKYLGNTVTDYKKAGLVEVTEKDGIVISMPYKTKNNFMGYQIYPSKTKALLTKSTAKKLLKANKLAGKYGYKLKLWDGYRPLSIQWTMYQKVNDIKYVAPPTEKWSNHSKGIAVDVTLVDKNNKELVMPTKFDNFTSKASRNYKGNSKTAQKNMELLTKIMKQAGFTTISSEWWHFNDTDEAKYKVLDVVSY